MSDTNDKTRLSRRQLLTRVALGAGAAYVAPAMMQLDSTRAEARGNRGDRPTRPTRPDTQPTRPTRPDTQPTRPTRPDTQPTRPTRPTRPQRRG